MYHVKHGPAPDFLQGEPNEFEQAGLEWRDLYHIETSGCQRNGIGPEKVFTLKHELARKFGGRSFSRYRNGRKWDKYPICAYCEVRTDGGSTKPEIDHFRPRSRFQCLTFKWDNLMYSCHECNREKGDKFPKEIGGYISPSDPECRNYFDYDFGSGRIRPKNSIDDDRLKARIEQLICDLKLNRHYLVQARKTIKKRIDLKISKNPHGELRRLLNEFTVRSSSFSSYATAYRSHLRSMPQNDLEGERVH